MIMASSKWVPAARWYEVYKGYVYRVNMISNKIHF